MQTWKPDFLGSWKFRGRTVPGYGGDLLRRRTAQSSAFQLLLSSRLGADTQCRLLVTQCLLVTQ
jgi:hypothetical protein